MTRKLRRELSFPIVLLLTVNAIIGTGIFFLPAAGAAVSGPSSLIAWAIMSVVALAISAYFAELVSMFPHAGGVYEFSKQAFGKLVSFITGWMAWIVANITMGMLIVGALQYLIPTADYLIKIVFALALILSFNYVSFRGVNISAAMLIFFAIATVAILILLIVPGAPRIEAANLQPLEILPLPMLLTIFLVAETFFGWETTTFLSEETKNPRKTLPRALVIGTAVVAILSFTLALVSLGVINWEIFAKSATPLIDVGRAVMGSKGALAVEIGTFIAIVGAAAGWVVTAPRLIMAMSRDRLFVQFCRDIHPKYQTPHKAIALQALVTSIIILIGFGSYEILLKLLLPLVLIMYSIVMLTVVKLRIKRPRLKRYFSAPFPVAGPLAIVVMNALLMGVWIYGEHNAIAMIIIGFAFVALGFPSYIAVRLTYDKRFKEKFFDNFSWFWDKFFPIWYGKEERKRVIRNAKIMKGDIVMDYGCFTGMTTQDLLIRVGTQGTVVAVDVSRKGLEMLESKQDGTMDNLILIKEEGILPFKKEIFDAVTLVSMLEHFGNPEDELRKLRKVLKKGGRISALSFGKVYGIPPPGHLRSEPAIVQTFKSAGFKNIRIERKKNLLTEYYFISAVK